MTATERVRLTRDRHDPTVTFLGATETVTGSRYLVEGRHSRVLVDCGLFQGQKRLRQRNWAAPGFDPASLSAVVLTHAHIDHTGYLPRLCQLGYGGAVHCTGGTADLLRILLPDAAHLQEEDARRANERGYARHRPALPLYTEADAARALERLRPHGYHDRFDIAPGMTATFTRAGHILGSGCLRLEVDGTTILFTGDVGRPVDPIMKPPEPPPAADYLVTESTYGDRRHAEGDVTVELERIVKTAAGRGGVVLVPAFAVGRAQHMLHVLAVLERAGRIPRLPVFLDSPMAINATRIFCDHAEDHRLSEEQCHAMCDLAEYTRTPAESKAIDARTGPMIVVSASGMATGGRILHHFRRFLSDARTTVVFAGFQAAGTRGRSLVDGADEIKLHGQYMPVRARIEQIHGLSAHADYREMLDWFDGGKLAPKRVFVTHGEAAAADAFRRRVEDTFGWPAVVPEHGSRWTLK